MVQLGSEIIDISPLWTFFLLASRFGGVFLVLPGIGSNRVSPQFRFAATAMCSIVILISGAKAPQPAHTAEMVLMLGSEFVLGYALGMIPAMVLGGLAVAGQVISGAIGLGQANMIDRSLGGNVAVLAQVKMLVATTVFLLIDGHHVILRAASGTPGEIGLGIFRPNMETAQVIGERLIAAFDLAVIVSGPVLITTLVTQFVLGLITKFVPQVNIFIISLPLSLMVGLYIMEFSFPGLVNHTVKEYAQIQEVIGQIFPPLLAR